MLSFIIPMYLCKVMKKYDELQYQAVVEGFSDTSKCPKCDYIAFVDEAMTTFRCVKCNFNSCRECGEEAHPGKRCDEVENQHETKGRNTVEEAMTNAVIRKCPRPMCRKRELLMVPRLEIIRWIESLSFTFFCIPR